MAQDSKLRIFGLACIALGIVFFWFFVLDPWRAAQAGAAEVSYVAKVFVLVPFCLVYGLAFLLLGENFRYRTEDHKNLTAAGWISFAIAAILAFAGWWWFDSQIAALGYV